MVMLPPEFSLEGRIAALEGGGNDPRGERPPVSYSHDEVKANRIAELEAIAKIRTEGLGLCWGAVMQRIDRHIAQRLQELRK